MDSRFSEVLPGALVDDDADDRGVLARSIGNHKILFSFFATLYVVSPADFDWIPVVGWIDDVVVVATVLRGLLIEASKHNKS